ncbi:MAG: putative glycosylase [Acidimicrobiia bacterium]|nr:putative glycosylase [Acidimicrobiia bacterium]
MPELPEVQAHAERLTEEFGGRVLSRFVPITFTALKNFEPRPEGAVGHPLRAVTRVGKYLLLDFEALTFAVHLMQGGRLKPDLKQSAKPRDGIARWVFEDGSALLLTEAGREHRAGVWTDPAVATEGLGPDALDLTADLLTAGLKANNMRLHGWLRNQRNVAGIGRRLANEICHRAHLSPFAMTSKLTASDIEALLDAIVACCAESLEFERSRADMSSSADRPSQVHHRTGQPCPVCGNTVREVEYSSHTVNYCPTCQTKGKVLADNTTSRFLK